MNYEVKTCEPIVPNDPMQTLTGMMQKTSAIAEDVLRMAEKINRHLFGDETPIYNEEANPSCLADECKKTGKLLLATAEELHRIIELLGV